LNNLTEMIDYGYPIVTGYCTLGHTKLLCIKKEFRSSFKTETLLNQNNLKTVKEPMCLFI